MDLQQARNTSRVLIVGAGGFLGSNLVLSARKHVEVVAHSRTRLADCGGAENRVFDLLNFREIDEFIRSSHSQVVINCSALADIDRCEIDKKAAFNLNVEVPRRLAAACSHHSVQFVHVSTDAVFGGVSGPYDETSSVSPINEYGRTKALGEAAVLEESSDALIVRTNFFGWSPTGKRSLLEFFVNQLESHNEPRGFTDIHFRPISVLRLWNLMDGWLKDDCSKSPTRIRHATGQELLSKYEFGLRVAKVFGFEPSDIQPSLSGQSIMTAPRATNLDVRPSEVPSSMSSGSNVFDLTTCLVELRDLAKRGLRQELTGFVG